MKLELSSMVNSTQGRGQHLAGLLCGRTGWLCFLWKRIEQVLHGEHWLGREAKRNEGNQFESHCNLLHYQRDGIRQAHAEHECKQKVLKCMSEVGSQTPEVETGFWVKKHFFSNMKRENEKMIGSTGR